MLIAGEIIKTIEIATDMDDHGDYLQEMNGGPLKLELQMQTSFYLEDFSNSGFDLYEVGAIEDKGTDIDPQWRRETRPKRIRPKSAADKETRKINEMVTCMDDASFDTSSHHTIDYLVGTKSAKSFTYGSGKRYSGHLKR
jgi:hypothetical protein